MGGPWDERPKGSPEAPNHPWVSSRDGGLILNFVGPCPQLTGISILWKTNKGPIFLFSCVASGVVSANTNAEGK